MKVFLCWQGSVALDVAKAFGTRTEPLLRGCTYFISTFTRPGEDWRERILREVDRADLALAFMARPYVGSHLAFEAGAFMAKSKIFVPFVINFDPGRLPSLFSKVQAARADRNGTQWLLRWLAQKSRAPHRDLLDRFDDIWPSLANDIASAVHKGDRDSLTGQWTYTSQSTTRRWHSWGGIVNMTEIDRQRAGTLLYLQGERQWECSRAGDLRVTYRTPVRWTAEMVVALPRVAFSYHIALPERRTLVRGDVNGELVGYDNNERPSVLNAMVTHMPSGEIANLTMQRIS